MCGCTGGYSMKENLMSGIKTAFPIALGYIPIAITFGILGKSTGVPLNYTVLMSILVFAGASQFVAINLLTLGTGIVQIIMTTFILNFRHFLMSASLSRKVKDDEVPSGWLAVLAFGITDETFSVSSMKDDDIKISFMLGLNLTAYLAWTGGTFLGYVAGSNLPEIIQASMGIALYAMFIGLLVPEIKGSKAKSFIFLLTVVLSLVFYFFSQYIFLYEGWRIILIAIISAFIGTLLFPEGEKADE